MMTESGAVTAHCALLFNVQTCQFARRPQKGFIFNRRFAVRMRPAATFVNYVYPIKITQ